MGGVSTFSGTGYQERVIAAVYVHILAQRRLEWFGRLADDIPLAVAGETDGTGDDLRLEFGDRFPNAEVQAKHRLNAGKGVDEVLARVAAKSAPADSSPVCIVIGSLSSSRVHPELADDLDCLRTGRDDALHKEAARLIKADATRSLVPRLYIAKLNLDHGPDQELHAVHTLLGTLLEDLGQLVAAWAVFIEDASVICARRQRRTAPDLRKLLARAMIKVKPLPKDARFVQTLDEAEDFINNRQLLGAKTLLRRVAERAATADVSTSVKVRLAILQAAAAIQGDDPAEGFRLCNEALALDSESAGANAIGAIAALALGDLPRAEHMADRAVQLGPDEAMPWGAKLHTEIAAGRTPTVPPPHVSSTVPYRQNRLLAEVTAGDWPEAIAITTELLQDNDRSPDTLAYRCVALVNAEPLADPVAMKERWLEVERLTTEALKAREPDDPSAAQAYTARGLARRHLGRKTEAEEDFSRAYDVRPDDPNAIRNRIASLAGAGRDEEALAILRLAAKADSLLLAVRAGFLAERGSSAEAQADIEEAQRRLPDSYDPRSARMAIAEVLLEMGQVPEAKRTLEPAIAERQDAPSLVLEGRIGLAEGDEEGGIAKYRAAAQRADVDRQAVLVALGGELHRRKRYAESVQALADAGGPSLLGEPLKLYAASLIGVSDFLQARAVVDSLSARGPLPAWALEVATEIALRTDDTEEAIRHLTMLVEHAATPRVKIALAKSLIEADRVEDAAPYLDELLSSPAISPIERAQAAELAHMVGRLNDAITASFRAYRDAPQDPQIQRSFATMLFTSDLEIPKPEVVGADTFVRLRGDDEEDREHTIYADGPIDPLRGEMSVEDAAREDLLGKHVGERIGREVGRWAEKQWTVIEILPALVHAAQDVVMHYEERFPGEPFFVTSVHIGQGTGIRDFVPIIGAVNARQEWVKEVLRAYREQLLPLSFVARQIGVSIPNLIDSTSGDVNIGLGPLAVEWAAPADQAVARAAVADGGTVVLTRSALHTAQELGLLEQLAGAFTLVAPRSLLWDLRDELLEAERAVRKGISNLGPGPAGFLLHEIGPDDPSLVERRDRLQAVRSWLGSRAINVMPRPLAIVSRQEGRNEQVRESVGRSSFDALALAEDLAAPMYVDDLGLRRYHILTSPPTSFSTITLLAGLTDRAVISATERDRLLLELVRRHYVHVTPTPELLDAAVRRTRGSAGEDLDLAFALLAGPAMSPAVAAIVLAQTLRQVAGHSIQTVSITDVVRLGLRAMASRAPMPLCARLVITQAERELAFLVLQLEEVRQACADETRAWIRGRLP